MKNILESVRPSGRFAKLLTLCLVLLAIACSKDDVPTTTTPTPNPTPTKSSAKDITKFSFAALSPAVDATIDATAKTISATVPAATDLTKLVPTITISDKATISPATGVAQDFSKEVSYTVTAEDASTVVWKVNLKKEAVIPVTITDPKPEDNDSPDGIYFGGSQYLGVLDITTGKKKWELLTNSGYSLPEVSNGVVYVRHGKSAKAFSALDGTLKWEKTLINNDQNISNPKIQSGVLVIATDGYFVYNNDAASVPAKVIGLDPLTGNVLWEYKQTQNKNGSSATTYGFPLTASDGNIYVVQDAKTLAIEAKTGKLKWEIVGDYSISDYNGFLLGRKNSPSNAIYKLNKSTGSPSILVPNTDVKRTPYVVSNGILYFADYNSSNAKIYALDANTGVSKWAVATTVSSTDWNNVPIVYNGLVCFSGSDKTIYAFDSQTGVKKWEAKTEVDNRVLIAAKDMVYSTNVIVSSETGQIKWKNTETSGLIYNFKLIKDKKLYEAQKTVNDK